MAPQLSWIGLGNMGRGMCKNLVEKGDLSNPLIIFNRTNARAEQLSEKLGKDKTKVASSIEDAVKNSDIIFTCVGDDKAMEDTVESMLKAGDVKGKLFVDCSTIHPDTTSKINKSITAKGAHFVACPVFGAPAMAESGQLVCVLAGPAADVEKVKPYTKGVMGRDFIDYSDQEPSKALLMKVIGNTFVINMVETLSEGHTLADKTGLGSDNLHQFVEKMFPGPYLAYSNRLKTNDYVRDEPLFNAALALKDARHALNLAKTSGVQMKALEVAKGHLEDTQKERGERGDLAGIYGSVRQEAGLPYSQK